MYLSSRDSPQIVNVTQDKAPAIETPENTDKGNNKQRIFHHVLLENRIREASPHRVWLSTHGLLL